MRGYLPGTRMSCGHCRSKSVYLGFPLLCLVLRREPVGVAGILALIIIGPIKWTC